MLVKYGLLEGSLSDLTGMLCWPSLNHSSPARTSCSHSVCCTDICWDLHWGQRLQEILFISSCLVVAKYVGIGWDINCSFTSRGSKLKPSAWLCADKTISVAGATLFFFQTPFVLWSEWRLPHYCGVIHSNFTSQLKSWCHFLRWEFPSTAVDEVDHTVGFCVNGDDTKQLK